MVGRFNAVFLGVTSLAVLELACFVHQAGLELTCLPVTLHSDKSSIWTLTHANKLRTGTCLLPPSLLYLTHFEQ
ncbi:hypothetical protein I79_015001 [Cricetulus griseus]|uniref:Secreted protein n=1 Tax=Cricetulus griseus TaxID=10029 RepID=G3HVL2_CRIGR|nr:hypothetical protein I79_015001 [Cricetulus griseus]